MNLIKVICKNIWELLVEDGWIAAGTVISLAVAGLWVVVTGFNETLRGFGGWLLLLLLMLLLVLNLYATGRSAARKQMEER